MQIKYREIWGKGALGGPHPLPSLELTPPSPEGEGCQFHLADSFNKWVSNKLSTNFSSD
jgi:hypothetical protein